MSSNKPKDVNSRCTLISKSENEALFRMLGPNCLTLSSGVVQLFLADPGVVEWRKCLCGVACFVKDSNQRSYFIRIYDIKRKQMVWQQELYTQFRYRAPRDFVHTFEADTCQAALNFASEDEALAFKHIVDLKLTERHQRRLKRKSKLAPNAAGSGNARRQLPVQNTDHNIPVHTSGGSECVICMEAEAETIFLECGHMVSCAQCSQRLETCPFCRVTISRKIRVYKS